MILVGGAVGSLARYLLSRWVNVTTGSSFPWGTLVVNLLGALIIGFLTGLFERWVISPQVRLLIFVGFLGGFTTFSTFGLETFNLFKQSEFLLAFSNFALTNVLGLAFVAGGYALAGALVRALRTWG
ncbi:MAG: fluoride efflux transporter CrcB [Spirochaetales bacterium]|nr:fluoride efflux transporter CrcB [Spirochaetales bacterium]